MPKYTGNETERSKQNQRPETGSNSNKSGRGDQIRRPEEKDKKMNPEKGSWNK